MSFAALKTTGMETPWNANWRFECEKCVLILQDDEVFIQRKTDTIAFPEGYRQYLIKGAVLKEG